MMQPPSILGLKKLGLNRTFDFVEGTALWKCKKKTHFCLFFRSLNRTSDFVVTVSLARFHKAKRLKEWYYVMEIQA